MRECALANKLVERRSGLKAVQHHYYSVEFSINGLGVPHQFRIWNIASSPMSILVREDSHILPMLKVGDTLDLKYYSTGADHATEYQETAITHITKHDQGRFKGHYLVELEILGS